MSSAVRGRLAIGLLALAAGCQAYPASAPGPAAASSLVVKPSFVRHVMGVRPYIASDVRHITFKLYSLATGAEVQIGDAFDLAQEAFADGFAFKNLTANTRYRVRAFAYETPGEARLLSVTATSVLDLTIGNEASPTMVASVPVQLIPSATAQVTTLAAPAPYTLGANGQAITDAAGNFYITDTDNGRVLKVAADHTATELATGLDYPRSLAIAANGDLYVACQVGNALYKIDGTTGAVAPFATSLPGCSGVALDAAGTLYVTLTDDHTVRRVAPDGTTTVIAGLSGTAGNVNGLGADARFSQPVSISLDASGNLYVLEFGNGAVRRITPSGYVTTVLAGLFQPNGLAVDADGVVYVAETGNRFIRAIFPQGNNAVVAGTGAATSTDGVVLGPTPPNFTSPFTVTWDATERALYVYDQGKIRKVQ